MKQNLKTVISIYTLINPHRTSLDKILCLRCTHSAPVASRIDVLAGMRISSQLNGFRVLGHFKNPKKVFSTKKVKEIRVFTVNAIFWKFPRFCALPFSSLSSDIT